MDREQANVPPRPELPGRTQQAAAERGAPEYIRCDNGPEFVAAAIQDWWGYRGVGTSYIAPGSPWETPFVESFNGKARDEFFAREIFDSVFEARVLWEDFCHVYNHERPHSSLSAICRRRVFAAALKTSEPS